MHLKSFLGENFLLNLIGGLHCRERVITHTSWEVILNTKWVLDEIFSFSDYTNNRKKVKFKLKANLIAMQLSISTGI